MFRQSEVAQTHRVGERRATGVEVARGLRAQRDDGQRVRDDDEDGHDRALLARQFFPRVESRGQRVCGDEQREGHEGLVEDGHVPGRGVEL